MVMEPTNNDERLFLLQTDDRLTQDQVEQIIANWKSATKGKGMRAVLVQGGISVTELTQQNRVDVKFIRASDWGGVYLNGKLIYEEHFPSARELEALLKHIGGTLMEYDADEEWMEREGRLPENWDDVKWL